MCLFLYNLHYSVYTGKQEKLQSLNQYILFKKHNETYLSLTKVLYKIN